LQPFNETLAIRDMRRLCHFEREQDFPRHVCRSGLAPPVPLELINDLALPQNVSLAFTNVAFGLSQAIEQQ